MASSSLKSHANDGLICIEGDRILVLSLFTFNAIPDENFIRVQGDAPGDLLVCGPL